jgi:4-hydroxy-L-threonine phosphate dehydrogenase PdxA
MKKIIPIVLGEPKSINTEIIYKSLKIINNQTKKNILLIGSYDLLKAQLKILKKNIKLNKLKDIENLTEKNGINILDVSVSFKNAFKINNKETKKYVIKCLTLAHKLSNQKKIKGFINCSIDKNIFNKKIGVTEFLADLNNVLGSEVMIIYSKTFSVVPITTHIDLKDVSKQINKKNLFKKIKNLNIFYKKIFKKKPLITVLGLNPHNNEMRTNSEEKKIILPTIKELKKNKINIEGPFSADEVFLKNIYKPNQVVVGMYHDQVLAPFKSINKFNAINITLGLKYLRVSPDHGTGHNILFKNIANPESLLNSINFFSKSR